MPIPGILEVARAHQTRDVQVEQILVDGRESDTAAAQSALSVVPAVSGENMVEVHFGDRDVRAWGPVDEQWDERGHRMRRVGRGITEQLVYPFLVRNLIDREPELA